MKIIIVDDNETFRSSLRLFLSEKYGCQIIVEAESADIILNSPDLAKADIILMDIVLPGIDGIEASKIIIKKHHDIKIIVITMHHEKVFLEQLLNTGIKGCIFKDQIFNDISEALDTVIKGEYFFPEKIVL